MIPHNRPVINERDIAQQAGVPLATWRRRDAPGFRQRVPPLFDSRVLIYDQAQAHAFLNGQPIPPLPTEPHPDDLLNDEEAAALLGVTPSTVRAYASQNYLPRGTTVYSLRLWTRKDIETRRDTPPRQGQGGGRPPAQTAPTKPTPTKATPACASPQRPSPHHRPPLAHTSPPPWPNSTAAPPAHGSASSPKPPAPPPSDDRREPGRGGSPRPQSGRRPERAASR